MNELATAPANAGFMSINDALVHVERCRAENRLIEAEAVCRRILEAQPDLAIAEHLLGLIAHQNGRLGDAIVTSRRQSGWHPRSRSFTPISARCSASPAAPSSPPNQRAGRSRSSPPWRWR
jgi:hypothetical protein